MTNSGQEQPRAHLVGVTGVVEDDEHSAMGEQRSIAFDPPPRVRRSVVLVYTQASEQHAQGLLGVQRPVLTPQIDISRPSGKSSAMLCAHRIANAVFPTPTGPEMRKTLFRCRWTSSSAALSTDPRPTRDRTSSGR
ncbi:hypothetical protein [Streptomyces sp. NPDC005322]|uniref:hypothetical protein n=1 Tax=Streptomyces sp. NPDC005322 TaxID=3157032 RepID=UPI0033BABDAB